MMIIEVIRIMMKVIIVIMTKMETLTLPLSDPVEIFATIIT